MNNNLSKNRQFVAVVVLGDLGHSPRVLNHAVSLAEEGYDVYLIGYSGSKPPVEVLENQHIFITYMKRPPSWLEFFPSSICYIFKVFWRAVILFFTLLLLKQRPKYLLMQNPPAIPTMPVCWFYCLISRVKFLIDWHNYGHTIMALQLSKSHPIVFIYKTIEQFFGRLSSGGLCVTDAMQNDLEQNWKVYNIISLHDKPSKRFFPLVLEEKHEFFMKLADDYSCFSSSSPDKSIFTERLADGKIRYYEDRPALLVSSTSWTEDEDFSILFYALQDYEKVCIEFPGHYPQLIVVVTGKGPLKDHYISLYEKENWQYVILVTMWLAPEDYPRLLACADLGISLHFSSSGFDLPMKIVDMFGCGLVVAALGYSTLSELVKHNENGFVFDSKEELANFIQDWFRGFPKLTKVKESHYSFCKNIDIFRSIDWHSCWRSKALPLFSNFS